MLRGPVGGSGEHERVAGFRTGRERCRHIDEATGAGGIDEHEAAAAVLDELDAPQRVGAAGATAGDRPGAGGRVENDVRERERGGVNGGVQPGAAVERVVAAVAGDDVVEPVAGAVDVAAAGQGEVLDIGGERVADRRPHRVDAFADGFRDDVADVVDDIGVVAEAADHAVGAGAAVERVVAGAAGERRCCRCCR